MLFVMYFFRNVVSVIGCLDVFFEVMWLLKYFSLIIYGFVILCFISLSFFIWFGVGFMFYNSFIVEILL